MIKLTQERLKELFRYNSETGDFVRKKTVQGYNSQEGRIAGCNTIKGYLSITIDAEMFLSHRLAWFYIYGKWPKDQIDHINHKKKDNRITNLRQVNNQENHRNSVIQSNNKTGVTGVCWDTRRGKWLAFMKLGGKSKNLGGYVEFVDAVIARKMAEYQYGYHINHGT